MRHLVWLLVLVIVGCGTTPAISPTAVTPSPIAAVSPTPPGVALDVQVAELRAADFGTATVETVVHLLAGVGVGTYLTPESAGPLVPVTEPASPLVLLHDQVRAVALEAWAGTGIEGAELDALVDTEPDLAPPSYILAGYVAAVDTDGAQAARALMGEQDWAEAPSVLFPQLALVLFTADIARERMLEAEIGESDGPIKAGLARAGGSNRAPANVLAVARPIMVAASGACTEVSNFISGALHAVFDAIRLGESSNSVASIFITIWNFVVGVLETVVTTIVKKFEESILHEIGRVAAIVGTVATIVSAIRPWTLTVSSEQGSTSKGLRDVKRAQQGEFVARVHLGDGYEWPHWAKDCAQRAERPLPNLAPEGAPVTWHPLQQAPAGLVQEGLRREALDAHGAAGLDFTTLVDWIEDPHEIRSGSVVARITVERQSLRDLAEMARNHLFSELPMVVAGALYEYLGPSMDRILRGLGKLITVHASGRLPVLYHVHEDEPTPEPRPVSPPPPEPPPAADQFCERYVALLRWWTSHMGSDYELTRPWAAEIVRQTQAMRPFAPAELLSHVDLVIRVYDTYARGGVTRVPIVGPEASQLVAAARAMDAYCGIQRGVPPYEDLH